MLSHLYKFSLDPLTNRVTTTPVRVLRQTVCPEAYIIEDTDQAEMTIRKDALNTLIQASMFSDTSDEIPFLREILDLYTEQSEHLKKELMFVDKIITSLSKQLYSK